MQEWYVFCWRAGGVMRDMEVRIASKSSVGRWVKGEDLDVDEWAGDFLGIFLEVMTG